MTPPQTPEYMLGHRIKNMHEEDRPREGLLKYVPIALSHSEWLAIVL
jgi:DNA repair protein RadC